MLRMNILNAVEREAFDSPPVFNSFQRKQILTSPPNYADSPLASAVRAWRKPASCSSRTALFAGIISTFRRS